MDRNSKSKKMWNELASCLKLISGFRDDARCRLYKTQQSYSASKKQHTLIFTLVVEDKANLPDGKMLAEEECLHEDYDDFDNGIFKILHQLIDVLKLNYITAEINKSIIDSNKII